MRDRCFGSQAIFIEILDTQAAQADLFCSFKIYRQVMLVVRSQLDLGLVARVTG